jgi:OFA family oxalate/formate antiporter-like MFS transporter
VPLTNVLVMETGRWKAAFIIASLFNVTAALLANFVLKPMRQRLVTRRRDEQRGLPGSEADLKRCPLLALSSHA